MRCTLHRWALPGAILTLLLLMVIALGVGDMPLNLGRIRDGLLFRDDLAATVIWQIRMPRLIVAVFVGASLAASGLVMQAYFRNSLASGNSKRRRPNTPTPEEGENTTQTADLSTDA